MKQSCVVHIIVVAAVLAGSPCGARAQGSTIAITSVTLIDGTGGAARTGMTVIVRDGHVTAVEPAASAQLPADATVVDGSGKFLIPGLWDMHVHLSRTGAGALPLLAANGVTSVRDMGGDAAQLRGWRDDVIAGRRIGPRIAFAGPTLESSEGMAKLRKGTVEPVDRFRAEVRDVAAADRVVDSVAKLGVGYIKVRTVGSTAIYRAIAAAAARNNLPLVGHATEVPFDEILRANQRSIEHAVYPSLQELTPRQRSSLIADMARRHIVLVPTAVSYYQSVSWSTARMRHLLADSLGTTDPRRRYISGYMLEDWREQLEERPGGLRASIQNTVVSGIHKSAMKDAQEMRRAGVHILAGSDLSVIGIYPGSSLHDELRLFVEKLGMTPMEAIISATRHPAEFMGMQDSVGTIAKGNVADMVLLAADPIADIGNTMKIDAVVLRGRLLDRATLDKMTDPKTARTGAK